MNNTQLIVRTSANAICWLEERGFNNPHQLPNGYAFPVFIVDLATKQFFGTNTTCMAASCSAGRKPLVLDFEQLKEKLKMD